MDPKTLKIMIEDCINICLDDGQRLTTDMRNLMIAMQRDIQKFITAYKKAIQTRNTDLIQNSALKQLWLNIYENNQLMAIGDQSLSGKEMQILMRIAETILNT